jgi:hypothetical protein
MRWLALLLALITSPAAAMNLSSAPPKFNIPWANSPTAGGPYLTYPVPQGSQIGITNCAASLTDGFPPLTFQALSAGGCGPKGQDFNGILKQITLWNQWAAAGGVPIYDATFSTAISGYPLGALASQSAQIGCYWVNTTNGNTTNPDSTIPPTGLAGGGGWTSACPGGGVSTVSSTGSANAQTVSTATPFRNISSALVTFKPGLTNTAGTTLNINSTGAISVTRESPLGVSTTTNFGEVQSGQYQQVILQGNPVWLMATSPAIAYLNIADQTMAGGVAPTVHNIPFASTINVDCGLGPLQYVSNTGPITLNAPVNDCSCFLQFENGVGAGVVSSSGFTGGGSTGDTIDQVNGHKFVMHIWRIHNVTGFFTKALQ